MSIPLSWKMLTEVLSSHDRYINYPIIQALLKNKVLYFAGLVNASIRSSSEWQELARRRNLQLRALGEFAEVAEKMGIRYIVVKTFKLFPYVPDDIDILVLDYDRTNDLIERLVAKGYFIRSIGTPEITVRKVKLSTYVDLDIHHKMAAGDYIYYYNEELWRNRRELEIGCVRLLVPSWEDECLLTISHAVMKEFEVLASDLLHVLLCQTRGYIRPSHLYETGHMETYRVFMKTLRWVVLKEFGLPYRIPMVEVMHAYVHHLKHRLRREGLLPLKELMHFPRAKGIKRLLSLR
jgi:hypothetical protein